MERLSILLAGQLPGLRPGFTEYGIKNFKDQAVPALLKLILDIPITDYTAEVGISFFKIASTLNNCKIPDVNANF